MKRGGSVHVIRSRWRSRQVVGKIVTNTATQPNIRAERLRLRWYFDFVDIFTVQWLRQKFTHNLVDYFSKTLSESSKGEYTYTYVYIRYTYMPLHTCARRRHIPLHRIPYIYIYLYILSHCHSTLELGKKFSRPPRSLD